MIDLIIRHAIVKYLEQMVNHFQLKILLIKRGECKFDEKIACVHQHGAIGAIVYDSKDVQTLDKMKIDDKTRNITAVFTYKVVGEQLAKIVDEEKIPLNVSITPGKFGKPPNINRTSVLFVSISFIVLMIISFVWLVFYYVQRFRYLQTKDRKSVSNSYHISSKCQMLIAKIPTKSIKSDETNDIDNDCCAICIEPYKTTDIIRVLPCKHEFHKGCIDPWLLEHRTCPFCKMDILKHYGFVFTGSQESILQLDMDLEDGDDSNDTNHERIPIRPHSVSPTFIIQLNADSSLRRHSAESTGSAAREFSAYQLYRQQLQSQSDANCTEEAEREVCIARHHNPIIEITRGYLAPTELRQRAVSLPCALRNKNSGSSCHGSNNCYAWALQQQRMSKRNEDNTTTGNIVNKCFPSTAKKDTDDVECLLKNECKTNNSEQSISDENSPMNEIDIPYDTEQDNSFQENN